MTRKVQTQYPSKSNLLEVLAECYKNLDQPDYSFVAKESRRHPYRSLTEELLKYYYIKDVTDANIDVSIHLSVLLEEYEWSLWVSFLAPVACLVRVRDSNGIPLAVIDESTKCKNEATMIRSLTGHHIALLGKDLLDMHVPLKLFNIEPPETQMFQGLFSDMEFPPWIRSSDVFPDSDKVE